MSKNTNKKVENKTADKVATKVNGKGDVAVAKLSDKKLLIIITSAILALILLASSVIFTVDWIVNDRGFDYLKSNLSRYVSISEADYKDYLLKVDIAKPRDVDVENAFLSLLAANKGDRLCDEGTFYTSGETVRPGSVVNVWYRGYLLDENGEEIFVDGLCNFSDSTPLQFEVGSLYFPAGIEVALNGYYLNSDRTRFVKITDGQVTEDQILYLNISKTVTSTEKTTKTENVRVDLSKDIDAEYGVGFKEHMLSMSVGATKEFGLTDNDGVHNTYKVEIAYATDFEKNDDVLSLEAYFSYNTSIQTLRNEDVMFDIYVVSVQPYEYKELTDEFLKEVVDRKESKMTMEKLETYEGETIIEKYRSYIKEDLNKTYEKEYNSLIESALWDLLHSKATIKKYPKSKIDELYMDYITDVELRFAQDQGMLWSSAQGGYVTYKTLDEYAAAYYGYTKSTTYPTWKDYIRGMSEMLVSERLIFYYIMRNEGFEPTEQQFNDCYESVQKEYLEEYIENYLEYEGKTEETFETPQEYQEYIALRRDEFYQYYDDEYFVETTYYKLFIDTILSWGEISTLDERRAFPQDK